MLRKNKVLFSQRWFSRSRSVRGSETNLLEERISIFLDNPEKLTLVWRNFLEWNPELLPEPMRSKLADSMRRKAKLHAEYRDQISSEVFDYDQIQVYRVITNYHMHGHLSASIDPLSLRRPAFQPHNYSCPYRDKASRHQVPLNKHRSIILPDDSFIGGEQTVLPLKEIMIRFNDSYCHHMGVEFMTNTHHETRQWMKRQFEEPRVATPELRRVALRRLVRSTCFEEFMAGRGQARRYSARGCEILVPALQGFIDFATAQGAQSFVLGMTTSRARLNVLANVFKKPLQQVFVRLEGGELELLPTDKYVLGNNTKKVTTNQALPTEFAVLAGTSEGAGPVASGKARAEQLFAADEDGRRVCFLLLPTGGVIISSTTLLPSEVWPIVIHDDNILSGQGLAFENLRLSMQESYSCKGTVHIVLTNQENLPSECEDIYCTSVAHATMTPVIHVNSLDPDSVIHCMSVAAQYRAKFKSDIVVDLICYPNVYPANSQIPTEFKEMIDKQPSLLDVYSKQLVSESIMTWEEIEDVKKNYNNLLEYSFDKAQKSSFKVKEWLDSPWKRFFDKKLKYLEPNTAVIPSVYKMTLENFLNYQADINIHPSILNETSKNLNLAKEHKINWVMAECLAISTILQEGYNVRLTGEQSEEGQSLRRHHRYWAVDSEKSRIPLRGIYKAQGYYTVTNSPSCEFAALGFALGFSQANPKTLVMWEGTEEDQTSLAQYMLDVFLAAGEQNWFRQTGIVLLIPHGMEGAGEGASTGRPERFLQMCNEDWRRPETSMPHQLACCNWIVANVTTPANYFHVLRRQLKLNYRKPLVLFTHKELYANPDIYSHRKEFLYKKKFQVYMPDPGLGEEAKRGVQKVLLCTGRLYYELVEARREAGLAGKVAVCRVEQLSPFPYAALLADLAGYRGATVHWVQEEHRNQGWWCYVRQRLRTVLETLARDAPGSERSLTYIGRATSPLTATSDFQQHLREKDNFIQEAMRLS